MGTSVEVLVPSDAAALIGETEALFATWEAILSRFQPRSELSLLNAAAGRDVPVSGPLYTVIRAALRGAAASDGLFDPTLLRQLEDMGYDRTFADVPAREADATPQHAYLSRPGGAWRDVRLDTKQRTVRLPVGVGLDLGGIAKGMAVDAAIVALEHAGCSAAAVDAGGDLAVLGLPSGEAGWPVRIELPEGGRVVSLSSGALATSGISRRRWRWAGREAHHLINPRTGLPAESGLWSATAVADSCELAEVAATAAFLLGPVDGAAWLAARDLDGLLVLADGRQVEAGAWADR